MNPCYLITSLTCAVLCAACQPEQAQPEDVPITLIDMGAEQDLSQASEEMNPEQDMAQDMRQPEDMRAPCVAPDFPERITLKPGQRTTLKLPTAHMLIALEHTSELVAWEPEPGRVVLRAAYTPGEFAFAMTLGCAGQQEQQARHDITVEVKPLAFEVAQDWGAQGPGEREHGLLLRHPDDPDGIYLYGGLAFRPQQFTLVTDFWRFDRPDGTWSEVSVVGEGPRAATMRMVYSERRGAFLTVGGDDLRAGTHNKDLFEFVRRPDGSAWEWKRTPLEADFRHSLGALAYDEEEDRLAIFYGLGGLEAGAFDLIDSHITLDLKTSPPTFETRAYKANSPTPRYGFAYFQDPLTQRFYLAGGGQDVRTVDPVADQWFYEADVNEWTQLPTANVRNPFGTDGRHAGGRNACWAFDATSRRLFVWGGTENGRLASAGMFAMHLDGEEVRWHEVALPPGFPAVRASCMGGHDAGREEVFFGFGNSEQGLFQDLAILKL